MQQLRELNITSSLTFPELWKLDTPSVCLLNYGEKNTAKGEAVFQKLIIKLIEFFGGNWSNEQIKDCGKTCFDEWYYLTFAELGHFSQKAKSGAFKEPGKPLLYGPLTPANVIEWFCIYTSDNEQERANYFGIGNKLNTSKWLPPTDPVSPEAEQQFKETLSELEKQLTDEIKKEEEESLQKRVDDIKKFQDFMKASYDRREKNKTIHTQQVPDSSPNEIPNL